MIPTEPIGSIPRTPALLARLADTPADDPSLDAVYDAAVRETLAGEPDPERVLKVIRAHLKPQHRVFVGVVPPIDAHVEAPDEVCRRVVAAAKHIPVEQLGTTDDCGVAPFCDDTSTSRDTAFAKIRARVEGTAMASGRLAR